VENGFVDALLASLLGVAGLGLLEAKTSEDARRGVFPHDTRRDAVAMATEAVRTRSLGSALAVAMGSLPARAS